MTAVLPTGWSVHTHTVIPWLLYRADIRYRGIWAAAFHATSAGRAHERGYNAAWHRHDDGLAGLTLHPPKPRRTFWGVDSCDRGPGRKAT